jgi:hypothetical protein
MTSFIESYTTFQKNKKNKRKRSANNDTSHYNENYLQSFKNTALKPKRAKIVIPTTEVTGEKL